MLDKVTCRSLSEWYPVSLRILTASFTSKFTKFFIVQCYAPKTEAEEGIKDTFYEQLLTAQDRVPKHDLLIVMGDLNVKVGSNSQGRKSYLGRFGTGKMNENGRRLLTSVA